MNDLVSLRQSTARGRSLHLRAPEDVHHLLGGVGAGGVPLPAQDLALGGEAELGGEVVLGLGGGGVHLVLLGLAVTENGGTQTSDNIPTSVLHMMSQQQKESPNPKIDSSGQLAGTLRAMIQPRVRKSSVWFYSVTYHVVSLVLLIRKLCFSICSCNF